MAHIWETWSEDDYTLPMQRFKDEDVRIGLLIIAIAQSSPTSSNRTLALEMGLCRCVDNYLCFLSDVVRQIHQWVPKSLGLETTQITVEECLKFSTHDELIRYVIDKKITALSFDSIDRIRTYLKKQVGFDLFASDKVAEQVQLLNAYRNLIVHNRGMVDNRFLKMIEPLVASTYWKVGEQIDFGALNYDLTVLNESAKDIDVRLRAKYGDNSATKL